MISIQYKNTEMLKFLYPKKYHRFNVFIRFWTFSTTSGILHLSPPLFLQAHDPGHFPILLGIFPTYPALISRAEQTGTANNSRQSRVSHRHPRDPLERRRRTRPQSHKVTLHAITFSSLPPCPSLASLWITERGKNRRFDNGAKTTLRRLLVANSIPRMYTHPPLAHRGPFQASKARKSGSLSSSHRVLFVSVIMGYREDVDDAT